MSEKVPLPQFSVDFMEFADMRDEEYDQAMNKRPKKKKHYRKKQKQKQRKQR